MQNILILGFGKFGRRAARILLENGYHVTVVDSGDLADEELKLIHLIACDAVSYLHSTKLACLYAWIVPAVPVHIAFDWLSVSMEQAGFTFEKTAVPEGILSDLAVFRNRETLYVSMGNQICPADCPEPEGYCQITGQERARPLNQLISALSLPGYDIHVIRSWQLAPGVGGIAPKDLDILYNNVLQGKKQGIIATSCSCHAVLNAYCK